jgi:hypothetical protein
MANKSEDTNMEVDETNEELKMPEKEPQPPKKNIDDIQLITTNIGPRAEYFKERMLAYCQKIKNTYIPNNLRPSLIQVRCDYKK